MEQPRPPAKGRTGEWNYRYDYSFGRLGGFKVKLSPQARRTSSFSSTTARPAPW